VTIWDIHCHLPSPLWKGVSLVEQADRLLEIAGRVGIERIGLFLRTGKLTGPESDAEVLPVLERYAGRVFGFVWCDLFEVQRSIDFLQKWVGDGPMIGLKLGGYSGICSKPEYAPVFEKAIDLQAVIYQHTWIKLGGEPPRPGGGNLPHESQPSDLVEVARRYSDYPFICGHTGGDWELGIRMVRSQTNVSVELGGGYPTSGIVEMAVRELGPRRIIYGSDVTGRSFAAQLGKVHGAAIPDEHKRLIFSENFRRHLQPICRQKGWEV
jgi:predicted TIM-barrel fold metal-dependent hydrolase